ncbi:hypothetical protein KC316_g188 [Hortaea werneckii]|nr:hypothetical protein KC324_g217 [Hortaea werneckii]KAI7595949.1 hypothetical protein KC316_g188 [Hortaea werneckii]
MKDDQLPRLRFDDGDVIIKLSTKPYRHLLVHSDVIRIGLPTLAPALKPEWSVPEVIEHPRTGKKINVHSLALKSADQTILLEGKEVAINLEERVSKIFPRSDLVLEGWPDTNSYGNDVHSNAEIAKHAHHALVALLYGYHIPRWSIHAGGLVDEDREKTFNHETAEMAAIILSYAEYYGGLERIAPLLPQHLECWGESFWRHVALHPKFYIMLATKMQNVDLYSDALRHLVVQNRPKSTENIMHYTPSYQTTQHFDRQPAPEVLDMTSAEYAERFQPDLDALDFKLHKLEHDLLALQLHSFSYSYDRRKCVARTHFLNFIRVKSSMRPDRSANAKAWEHYEFLARSLWGQWLTQQLTGEQVYLNTMGKVRANPTGPFNVTCRKIVEAAATEDPSRLLKYKCASRLSSLFSLGFQFQAERRVKRILGELVREAARIIEAAFVERETGSVKGSETTGEGEQTWGFETAGEGDLTGQDNIDWVVYRRGQYDEVGKNFSHLGVKNTDLPWEDKGGESVTMPEVDRTEASEEWLEALGLMDGVLPRMWQELLAE